MRRHIAVLFYRIGPYHFARLKTAGEELRVTAVEFSNVDPVYAWDLVEGKDNFDRVTLFRGLSVESQDSSRIRNRMGAVLAELRPDVVAIPGWADRCSFAALSWCLHNKVPAVVMSETTAWDEPRTALKEAVKQRVISLFSSALVGGVAHRDYLLRLGFSPDRICLGYDAVDNDHFAEKIETLKEETRAKYALPERYFLASARFVKKKNLAGLLEAYALYKRNAERLKAETLKTDRKQDSTLWDLVLLGDGELRPELKRRSASLGVQEHVHMPGFKQYPELPAYYGLASAFVHGSTTEPWGLVVNEAMAAGLPVLVSNRCGCAPDLVKEGVNGFSFDPYNDEQLACLMLQVSALPPFSLSALGLASRQLIAQWGPARFAQGLGAAAQKALSVGSPGASWLQSSILQVLAHRHSGHKEGPAKLVLKP